MRLALKASTLAAAPAAPVPAPARKVKKKRRAAAAPRPAVVVAVADVPAQRAAPTEPLGGGALSTLPWEVVLSAASYLDLRAASVWRACGAASGMVRDVLSPSPRSRRSSHRAWTPGFKDFVEEGLGDQAWWEQ